MARSRLSRAGRSVKIPGPSFMALQANGTAGNPPVAPEPSTSVIKFFRKFNALFSTPHPESVSHVAALIL